MPRWNISKKKQIHINDKSNNNKYNDNDDKMGGSELEKRSEEGEAKEGRLYGMQAARTWLTKEFLLFIDLSSATLLFVCSRFKHIPWSRSHSIARLKCSKKLAEERTNRTAKKHIHESNFSNPSTTVSVSAVLCFLLKLFFFCLIMCSSWVIEAHPIPIKDIPLQIIPRYFSKRNGRQHLHHHDQQQQRQRLRPRR